MLRYRLYSSMSRLSALRHRTHMNALTDVINSRINTWSPNNITKYTASCNITHKADNMTREIEGNDEQEYCIGCERLFNEHPLSKKSKKNHICVGCARFYGQCRKDLDMLLIMKSLQTHCFGHGINSSNMIYQQLIDQTGYFTANKFGFHTQSELYSELIKVSDQADVATDHKDTTLLFDNDAWSGQSRNISKIVDERATDFLRCSKKRHRKLFPQAKIADEDFVFPTKSQLKGLMEASYGKCAWSGIQGFWKRHPHENTMFLLSFDHIVPVSQHGSWNVDNLQVVLRIYNSVKSNESEKEFKRWLFQ